MNYVEVIVSMNSIMTLFSKHIVSSIIERHFSLNESHSSKAKEWLLNSRNDYNVCLMGKSFKDKFSIIYIVY